ncbi:MAG: DDE-type integrase/transposase/recombinase [Deltaproteobacteria bacterium]|nr:DDE-type integrase/transposase/recombinase [Deltaproteobacteria bacterium]
MLRIVWTVIRTVVSAFRSRHQLVLENLALRQQLAAFMARGKRPRIRATDRAFWLLLRRLWARWADVPVIVKPDTVVRWHRAGFRLYWNCISRRGARRGRSPVDVEVRNLIRRMTSENGWGAPRIHGELLMLGIDVSQRTVSRYLRGLHRRPEARQSWLTFLRNHREAIAAMDLLVVFTATFRLLYAFFVIRHGRRQVMHFNVTEHPTATLVVQQLREAFPYDTAPKYLILDRDSIFATEVVAAIRAMGIKPARTAYRSSWQNGTAERWVGCCRQELLDHVVVANEAHLRRLLREHVAYHHNDRTHCGLGKQTPMHRTVQGKPSVRAKVIALPRLGGLHHRYDWRDAA